MGPKEITDDNLLLWARPLTKVLLSKGRRQKLTLGLKLKLPLAQTIRTPEAPLRVTCSEPHACFIYPPSRAERLPSTVTAAQPPTGRVLTPPPPLPAAGEARRGSGRTLLPTSYQRPRPPRAPGSTFLLPLYGGGHRAHGATETRAGAQQCPRAHPRPRRGLIPALHGPDARAVPADPPSFPPSRGEGAGTGASPRRRRGPRTTAPAPRAPAARSPAGDPLTPGRPSKGDPGAGQAGSPGQGHRPCGERQRPGASPLSARPRGFLEAPERPPRDPRPGRSPRRGSRGGRRGREVRGPRPPRGRVTPRPRGRLRASGRRRQSWGPEPGTRRRHN